METEFDKELFMDQCSLYFNFLLRKKQWSGLNQSDYIRWINNFSDIDDGRYIGIRILNSFLYYSDDDMLRLLDNVISNVFNTEIVLPLQIKNNFSTLPTEIEFAISEAVKKTIVMPAIEDLMDPGASGPEIIRDIRNHFTPQLQTIFNNMLPNNAQYDRIIIIDDCIGSGDQCRRFLEDATIRDNTLLYKWAQQNEKKIYYLALVGYKPVVESLQKDFNDVNFICAEYIDDQHQIFSKESECWLTPEEQALAQNALENKLTEHGISLSGHNELTFAVAFHKTIPDWSLPALFKNKNDWHHLVERKNTYD